VAFPAVQYFPTFSHKVTIFGKKAVDVICSLIIFIRCQNLHLTERADFFLTISNLVKFFFNWRHPDVFLLKYSKNKFSQNTTNLLSIINVATCFDS